MSTRRASKKGDTPVDKAARLKAAKKLGPGDQVCFDEPANVVVKVKSISEEGTDVLIRFEPVVKLNGALFKADSKGKYIWASGTNIYIQKMASKKAAEAAQAAKKAAEAAEEAEAAEAAKKAPVAGQAGAVENAPLLHDYLRAKRGTKLRGGSDPESWLDVDGPGTKLKSGAAEGLKDIVTPAELAEHAKGVAKGKDGGHLFIAPEAGGEPTLAGDVALALGVDPSGIENWADFRGRLAALAAGGGGGGGGGGAGGGAPPAGACAFADALRDDDIAAGIYAGQGAKVHMAAHRNAAGREVTLRAAWTDKGVNQTIEVTKDGQCVLAAEGSGFTVSNNSIMAQYTEGSDPRSYVDLGAGQLELAFVTSSGTTKGPRLFLVNGIAQRMDVLQTTTRARTSRKDVEVGTIRFLNDNSKVYILTLFVSTDAESTAMVVSPYLALVFVLKDSKQTKGLPPVVLAPIASVLPIGEESPRGLSPSVDMTISDEQRATAVDEGVKFLKEKITDADMFQLPLLARPHVTVDIKNITSEGKRGRPPKQGAKGNPIDQTNDDGDDGDSAPRATSPASRKTRGREGPRKPSRGGPGRAG